MNKKNKSSIFDYNELALNALNAITLAAHADGTVESNEKAMFSIFLASANLSDTQKEVAETRFKKGSSFKEFTKIAKENVLFKWFLLVIYSNFHLLLQKQIENIY